MNPVHISKFAFAELLDHHFKVLFFFLNERGIKLAASKE